MHISHRFGDMDRQSFCYTDDNNNKQTADRLARLDKGDAAFIAFKINATSVTLQQVACVDKSIPNLSLYQSSSAVVKKFRIFFHFESITGRRVVTFV